MDLTLLLGGIIVLGVLTYIVLDGFDLGIGILFPFLPDLPARDVAVASIAPVWDGNETWLILGGAVLFGAFPHAYAVALPAFYGPLMVLLVALILRGLAFEFRLKARRTRAAWSAAFVGGSTLAAFCQGLLLGGLVEGVRVVDGQFAGGPFDWLTPFALACGVGVVAAYALLGATWLVLKAEGTLRNWARRAARRSLAIVLAVILGAFVYTPMNYPYIAERWLGGQHWHWLLPVPLATLLVTAALWRSLRVGATLRPYLYAIALFVLGYLGIVISLWPYMLPPSLTVWDAAAPRASQQFMLVAVGLSLPMVLLYTAYAYAVSRGTVAENSGYTRD